MSSDLTKFNGTFAQRQEYASSLKDYKILADFDGLLVAIDKNHPVNLYVSDLPNGRRTGISVTGKSYDIDGFKWIWSIHQIKDLAFSDNAVYTVKTESAFYKEMLEFIK